ncbi:MAG: anti-sigma factor antagonist [Clostridiales bacterium]|jgi:stage II sporulation protein AA (anti-sigma F factor antagonist)|nr:anti-sigma factor antagonist [Clostridiales bacterium]
MLTILRQDDSIIAQISGDLDHHNAIEIRSKIDDLLIKYPNCDLILNLSGLNFMDSSGIGVIIGRYRNQQQRGKKTYICGVNSKISKLIELSGIKKIVPIIDNPSAISTLNKGGEAV